MKHFITRYPVFLLLLPVFFVFHGYMENYDFIPAGDALLLTSVYLLAAILIAGIAWLFYRNRTKAALVGFAVMAFEFFFGSVQDVLRKWFPEQWPSRYSFILPVSGVLFLLLLFLLKKRKNDLSKLRYYLNVLLLVLILLDVALLIPKLIKKPGHAAQLPAGMRQCDTCARPDIYFILADEYAGNPELIHAFGFDNQSFLDSLATRNFHILPNSKSNYNYTPFAVASILDMDYLHLSGTDRSKPDLTYSYETIRDNRLLQFLEAHQYQFYNYSIFDFKGQPARTREGFLAAKTRLITSQTFLNRLDKEIRFNLISRWKSKSTLKTQTYVYKHNNENIYDLTWRLAEQQSNQPRFVYTHLEMPHYPYYYDSNGVEQPFEKLLEGNQTNKEAYISYLKYANKKLMALIDHILKNAATPPVIILMGDHGFRHFTEPVDFSFYFQNLAAIHLPSNNYTGYTDSLHGVNLFRTFLNHSFGQQLPYLKDSLSYLKD